MMRARRKSMIFLAVAVCLVLLASASLTLGQDEEPTATPPSVGQIGAIIGRSIGALFSPLLTPYQPPLSLDAYPGIQQTRTSDGGFLLGDPNAPVTLVEFADWGCSHCVAYKPVIDQFIDTYVRTGQAAFELRILPTAGGELTIYAARLAECVDAQRPGAFWALSEHLYGLALKGEYTPDAISHIPDNLNLDKQALTDCVYTAMQVQIDVEYASKLNVNGTPAVLIRHGDETPAFIRRGDQVYDGGGVPFDVLQFIMEGGSSDGGLLT